LPAAFDLKSKKVDKNRRGILFFIVEDPVGVENPFGGAKIPSGTLDL
jgi:hypothetical protein